MNWVNQEKGPECYCGMPTAVVVLESGRAELLCIFHTNAEGAMFPLPKERPENWPDLTKDELNACMFLGDAEDQAREDDE